MVPELVDKYIFLVQSFVEAGENGLSLEEIQRRWCNRYSVSSYPRRSFVNHRAAIEEVFGLSIECDRSSNRYRIAEGAVDGREAVDFLINTFTVNSLLTLGKERLGGRVSVEDVPSGQKFLTVVMQAMLDNACLEMTYRRYLSTEEECREIRPYAVKEFGKRWYVVAHSEQASALRVYAMDRILALRRNGKSFRMPKRFDVDRLFEGSYGMYLSLDEKPVLVKLRATPREVAYLRDLPLHPSQVLVDETEGIFALRVVPNPDFVMELCKRGNRLEVLEPQVLRDAVKDELKKALMLYEN